MHLVKLVSQNKCPWCMADRFSCSCGRASLEFLRVTNRQPHILHIHEWQASAVALLHWEKYHHNGLGIPRVVLTIHNLDNSGECSQEEFGVTGVPGEVFASVDKALDDRTIGHNPERINLLKVRDLRGPIPTSGEVLGSVHYVASLLFISSGRLLFWGIL